MKRIGLISDTHGFLDENVFIHFKNCDEIWHAGDFGNIALAEELSKKSGLPVKGAYGNIDGQDVRTIYPENVIFQCEDVKVFITHIGGYPPNYNKRVKPLMDEYQPQLFISGHSHILKIIFDEKRNCLHINPGAAGKQGWHKIRTIVRFAIDGKEIKDCEVIELGSKFIG